MRPTYNNQRDHERSIIPIVPRDEYIGSCNGFLLLCDINDNIIVLNPSTNYSLCLPWENINFPIGCPGASVHFGIGFSPTQDDYKVLRVALFQNSPDSSDCKVYSRNQHAWHSIGSHPFPHPVSKPGVYVNGALHWLLHRSFDDYMLAAFDVSQEEFSIIQMPAMDNIEKRVSYEVSSLNNDELIIFSWIYVFDKPVRFWILKDYFDHNTWLSYSIQIMPAFQNVHRFVTIHPLYRISNSKEKLMLRISPFGAYGYLNLKTNSFHFVPSPEHGPTRTDSTFKYVESIEDPWFNA